MEDQKEAWSAFIDGELSELEELRLVRQSDFLTVGPSVHRWTSVRDYLRGSREGDVLSHQDQGLLNQRISDALDAEMPLSQAQTPVSVVRRQWMPLAAAASVVIALTVGFFVQAPSVTNELKQTAAPFVAGVSDPIAVRAVDASEAQLTESLGPTLAQAQSPELKALDAETQARLRRYLEEHDRSAGLRASNAQFVGYPAPTK